jgi:hypothetical protein
MAVVHADGFEHGLTNSAGGYICDSIVQGPGSLMSMDTSVFKHGAYSFKTVITNVANSPGYLYSAGLGGTGESTMSGQMRFSATPTTRSPIFDYFLDSGYLRLFLETNGSVTLEFPTGSGQVTSPVLATNTFHLIEIMADTSGTAWTAQLRVNGSTISGQTTFSAAAGQMTYDMSIGGDTTNGTAKGAFTVYWDDLVITDAFADFPLGEYDIKGYTVDSVGTHNLDTTPSLHFFKHDNTTRTALTSSETTSYQMIDDSPMSVSLFEDRVQIESYAGTPTLPTWVGASTPTSSASSFSLPIPTGTQDGDILIAIIESANQTAATLSGGNQTWTEIDTVGGIGVNAFGATSTRIQAFWARRGATAPTSPTVSDTTDHQHGVMVAFRDCIATGSPIGDSEPSSEAAVDTSGSATGITTPTANEMVCLAVGTSLPDASSTAANIFSAHACASLTSITERVDASTNAGNGGGLNFMHGAKATAGATGAITFTSPSAAKAMMVFSLKGATPLVHPANTTYVEYNVANSVEATSPAFIIGLAGVSSSGAGSSATVKLRDSSADTNLFTGTLSNVIQVKGGIWELAPSGSGWTDALFDSLKIRFGFTNTVPDIAHLQAVSIQAGFPVSALTSNTTRDVRVTGKADSNAAFDARATGQATSDTSRDVRVTGSVAASESDTTRDARVTGDPFTFAQGRLPAESNTVGPHKAPNGNFYTVLSRNGLQTRYQMFKASDPTSTWTAVGGTLSPTVPVSNLNSSTGYATHLSGTVIHVAQAILNGQVLYSAFDTASDTWTVTNEVISAGADPQSFAGVAIAVRSDGDVIVLYGEASGGAENVYYARRESESWTADIAVNSSGSSWAGAAILAASDRIHLVYRDGLAIKARTLSSANALGTETTLASDSVDQLTGNGVSWSSGTKLAVIFPQDATNRLKIATWDDGATPTNIADTVISAAGVGADDGPLAALAVDGTILHTLFSDEATSDLFRDSNLGSGWGTDVEIADNVTVRKISANVYDRSGTKLAYLWDNNGTVTYSEISLSSSETRDVRATGQATSDVSFDAHTTGEATSSDTRDIRVVGEAPPVVQTLIPTSDVSTGTWGSTPLYAKLDESVADDNDFVTTPNTSTFEVTFTVGDIPVSGTTTIYYRIGKTSAGGTIDFLVQLMDGATEIDQWTHNNVAEGFTTFSQEVIDLYDVDDLRLVITGTVS